MKFILNGCDISFIAEAPEDITLKQLLKQCDKIKPDWCACGNANTIQAISYDFKMEYIDSYGDIELWKDPETGVEYFVYSNCKGYGAGGICPRYIAGGELYLDLERGEQND